MPRRFIPGAASAIPARMDHTHMAAAIALAARGLGQTWPNPSVGCVIASPHGHVIARARTAAGGRPHAETQALALAGARARGATAYVSLEPCAHHGQTPPCADGLVAAGIARVVIAVRDPDPRVDGAGIARLRQAGIEVRENLLAAQASEGLAGFLTRLRLGRPLVTLKLATTLDGRIATAAGQSRWITGPAARRAVHALRGRHDAVMTGIGTVLADDPDLTCRLPGYATRPTLRVLADTDARVPPAARLIRDGSRAPTWVLHARGTPPEAPGVTALRVPAGQGGLNLHAALQALGARGLTSVLVEGGAALAAGLLRADLIDRIAWFHAPALLGAEAWPALGPLGVGGIADMKRFRPASRGPRALGDDVLTEFVRLPE
jgi:diaminohydroxyphosphoribosylaminopyrimidine deaminase/5-amino-6-(5-phosphoribosylamino)uracil reductase